jgi:hypothetical protein
LPHLPETASSSAINTHSFTPTPINREAQSLYEAGIVHIPSKNSHIQPYAALATRLHHILVAYYADHSIVPGCVPAQRVNRSHLQYYSHILNLPSTLHELLTIRRVSESGDLTNSETLEAPTGFWVCFNGSYFPDEDNIHTQREPYRADNTSCALHIHICPWPILDVKSAQWLTKLPPVDSRCWSACPGPSTIKEDLASRIKRAQ